MLSGNEDLRYKRRGIKMINDQEPLVIKALEQDLIRSGYSYNKVRRHFAAFLLELLENGILRKIFGERLPNLVPHLKEAVANEEMDRNDLRGRTPLTPFKRRTRYRGLIQRACRARGVGSW